MKSQFVSLIDSLSVCGGVLEYNKKKSHQHKFRQKLCQTKFLQIHILFDAQFKASLDGLLQKTNGDDFHKTAIKTVSIRAFLLLSFKVTLLLADKTLTVSWYN